MRRGRKAAAAEEDMGRERKREREGREECRIVDLCTNWALSEEENPKRSECINRRVTVALTKIC